MAEKFSGTILYHYFNLFAGVLKEVHFLMTVTVGG